jgi:hypothetical protein
MYLIICFTSLNFNAITNGFTFIVHLSGEPKPKFSYACILIFIDLDKTPFLLKYDYALGCLLILST